MGTATCEANWAPRSPMGLLHTAAALSPPAIAPPFQRAIVAAVPRGPVGEDVQALQVT